MAATDAIVARLEIDRIDLLDMTGRNRLLNTPRSSARSGRLEINDELSQQVFTYLVGDKKSMSFLPIKTPEETETAR